MSAFWSLHLPLERDLPKKERGDARVREAGG